MREIKFRAWDKVLKKICLAKELKFGRRNEITTLTKDGGGISRFELMQFIGIKDKKGKEIYEGDIVKGITFGDKKELILFIKWNDIHACFDLFYSIDGNDIEVLSDFDFPSDMEGYNLEVIGNIYENQELLKEVK